jgi:hypothetical protein
VFAVCGRTARSTSLCVFTLSFAGRCNLHNTKLCDTKQQLVRFEVLTAVLLRIQVYWDVMLWHSHLFTSFVSSPSNEIQTALSLLGCSLWHSWQCWCTMANDAACSVVLGSAMGGALCIISFSHSIVIPSHHTPIAASPEPTGSPTAYSLSSAPSPYT